ncbi:MAG: diadenylate cyclase CdaA [Thermoanaerobaculia bacterium]
MTAGAIPIFLFGHYHLTWRDALDIAIVAVVIYNLLLLVRGTRAIQMILGLLVILTVYWIAILLKLPTLRGVLKEVLFYLPLAIIVLFAAEIRKALQQFGRNPFLTLMSGSGTEDAISDVVLAATSLSAKRIGALIALEGRDGLKTFIENGVRLDAAVSYELLVNIFVPGTPLHDGAVIVSGNRVASASSFLPLTQRTGLPKEYGTRHRAAIGLSEETDAVVVVISEERGSISLARDGLLTDGLDGKSLREALSHLSSRRHEASPA